MWDTDGTSIGLSHLSYGRIQKHVLAWKVHQTLHKPLDCRLELSHLFSCPHRVRYTCKIQNCIIAPLPFGAISKMAAADQNVIDE